MPNLIALGAGAGATALTLVLGLAFWPPMAAAPVSGKTVVSQPVFVASLTHGKLDSGAALGAATPASDAATLQPGSASAADASAMAKLAVALQTNPAPITAQGLGTTRSMTLSASARDISPASEAARRLCAQGLVAMAAGDISGARLFLERAAEGGDARALMVLGESYDPATLARMGTMGIKGDAARARDYYTKALAAGMGAARERMAALEAP
jgi:TPR repeat protein